jgi:hypothetical protein
MSQYANSPARNSKYYWGRSFILKRFLQIAPVLADSGPISPCSCKFEICGHLNIFHATSHSLCYSLSLSILTNRPSCFVRPGISVCLFKVRRILAQYIEPTTWYYGWIFINILEYNRTKLIYKTLRIIAKDLGFLYSKQYDVCYSTGRKSVKHGPSGVLPEAYAEVTRELG